MVDGGVVGELWSMVGELHPDVFVHRLAPLLVGRGRRVLRRGGCSRYAATPIARADVGGAALRAADACLFVVSAVDGVEVQTEVIWELAAEARLPRAIVINKIDRERASFDRTLDQLVTAFGTQVAPIQLPIGEEHEFSGIVDLLDRRAYRYAGDPVGQEGEWPEDLAAKAEPYLKAAGLKK